jgi:hypothetical protein
VAPRGSRGLWVCTGSVGASQPIWVARQDETDGAGISCRPLLDVAGDLGNLRSIVKGFGALERVAGLLP